MVMELLRGVTLGHWLHGPMEEAQTVMLLRPIMETLARIHRQGVLHRDLAPDNLMLDDDHSALTLIDFGAVGRAGAGQDTAKLSFSPVEQYQAGSWKEGPWTDVYALSAVMYFMLTGQHVPGAVERYMLQDDLRRPSAMGIKISPAL